MLGPLGPQQSRFNINFRNILSPQARWRIASALPAKQGRPRKPQTLYRLPAASAAQNQTDNIDWGWRPPYSDNTNPTAAEAVLDLTHSIEWLNRAGLLSGNLSHDDGFDFDFYR